MHKGPGDIGAHKRAFFSTGTIDLSTSSLLFDALSGAREAELVRRDRWALHEVGVLQPLVTEGAAQRGAGCQRGVREAGGVHWLQSSCAACPLAPHLSGAEPSLVHGGRRGWTAAVPPGRGVDLGGLFRGVTAPCTVCYQDQRSHGGLAILGRFRRRGPVGMRGGSGWWRGHKRGCRSNRDLEPFCGRGQPRLCLSIDLRGPDFTFWLWRRLPFPRCSCNWKTNKQKGANRK